MVNTQMDHAARYKRLRSLVEPLFGLSIILAGFSLITPYMFFATGSYVLLLWGFSVGANPRKKHALLMTLGISIDLALVLLLEIQRHAINTALAFSMHWGAKAHILASTLAVVLYFPVFYLGLRQLYYKASAKERALHLILGKTAFILRTLGFILMFTLLIKTKH